jgi:hypothetical protein
MIKEFFNPGLMKGLPPAPAVVRSTLEMCQTLWWLAVPNTSSRPSWFWPTTRVISLSAEVINGIHYGPI